MCVGFLIKAGIGLAGLASLSHATGVEVASVAENVDGLALHASEHVNPKIMEKIQDAINHQEKLRGIYTPNEEASKPRVRPGWWYEEECNDESAQLEPGSKNDKHFRCQGAPGRCVPLPSLCNYVYNCFDGSDETGCNETAAKENLKRQMTQHDVKSSLMDKELSGLNDSWVPHKVEHSGHKKITMARTPLHIVTKFDHNKELRKPGRGLERELASEGRLVRTPSSDSKHEAKRKPRSHSDSLEERDDPTHASKRDLLTDSHKAKDNDNPPKTGKKQRPQMVPLHIKREIKGGITDRDGEHPRIVGHQVRRSAQGKVDLLEEKEEMQDATRHSVLSSHGTERVMMRKEEHGVTGGAH